MLVLLIAGIAACAYYGVPKWLSLRDARARASSELQRLRHAARDAERDARMAAEELARDGQCESELAAARARLEGSERRAAERDDLAQRLSSLQGGEVSTQDGRITLKLVDTLLFLPGEDELTPAGIRVLGQLAEALREHADRQIWIQGHTDTSPIRNTERFRSNWELSTARAISVVHYLQDQAGIEPDRLAAVGFGEHRPVSAQKAKNRRIEIVLFPRDVRVVAEQRARTVSGPASEPAAPTKGL